jgi:hypothetical protein
MSTNAHPARFVIAMAFVLLSITLIATAQGGPTEHPSTDADKIADTLRAGPPFITNDATLLDWPAKPGDEYRVLRKGTNEWSCLPGVPGYTHDEPGCFDPVFMQWIKDSLAGRDPHIDKIGIAARGCRINPATRTIRTVTSTTSART